MAFYACIENMFHVSFYMIADLWCQIGVNFGVITNNPTQIIHYKKGCNTLTIAIWFFNYPSTHS